MQNEHLNASAALAWRCTENANAAKKTSSKQVRATLFFREHIVAMQRVGRIYTSDCLQAAREKSAR